MKKLMKIALAVCVLTMAGNNLKAQKIAHIALDSLIGIMPETKQAQDIAQNYLKDLEKQIASMQNEFDTKYNDYLTNEASYSDLVKKTKQEELQSLNRRIEDFRMGAQQDYQKKYTELSKPIYDKAKKAIDAVAKEGGYKYVLDTSSGIVLYSEPGDDILLAVKKKLETMPAAVLPGAGNANPNTPKGGNTTKPGGTGTKK